MLLQDHGSGRIEFFSASWGRRPVVFYLLEEWMNPHTKFFRSLAMLGALGVGLAACGDTTLVSPDPLPTITASPQQMSLLVNGEQAIVASVSGLANSAVSYESLNTAVASVTPAGMVRGLTAGTATIRVTSQGQPTLQTAVGVTVTAAQIPASDTARVLIESITAATTINPINPGAVAGLIDVTLSVRRGPATQLRVLVGTTEVQTCRQTFGSTGLASDGDITAPGLSVAANFSSVTCTINTAAFNVVGGLGVPLYPNVTTAIRAELRSATGVLDAATSGQLTFANNNTVRVTLASERNVINPATGLRWDGGTVTVTAVPVTYSGSPISTVNFSYTTPAATVVTKTATAPSATGFVVTYPGANAPGAAVGGTLGVTDPNFNVFVSTLRADGQPGPSSNSNVWLPSDIPTMRVDNQAPDGGTFVLVSQSLTGTVVLCCAANWVGPAYAFSAGKAGQADLGAGISGVTYHVGPAGSTNAQIAATPAITTAADLAETALTTTYRAVAVVTDRLTNQVIVPLAGGGLNPATTFGVDRTAPTLMFTPASLEDQSIFNIANPPAGEFFQVTFADEATGGAAPSGFVALPVLARVNRWFPGLTATNQCLAPGSFLSPNCRLNASSGTTALAASDGYFQYQATVVDQAGNLSSPLSAPISRIVLRDLTAPSASNIAIPANLVGGQQTTFTADASDNVNLWTADFRLIFGGVETLPFTPAQVFNQSRWVTGLAGLVTAQSASATMAFVRSLETTTVGNAPANDATAVSDISLLVVDAAGNPFLRTNAFAGGTVPAAAAGGFAAAPRSVQTFSVSGPSAAQDVWNGIGVAPVPAVPTSRTITVTAVGASGTFGNPFAALHVYRRDGATSQRIGTAGAPSVVDTGVSRTWTWTVSFSAVGIPAEANVEIFAVGVNGSGDALRSNDNTNISIVGTL
jgi:hypothetical protein